MANPWVGSDGFTINPNYLYKEKNLLNFRIILELVHSPPFWVILPLIYTSKKVNSKLRNGSSSHYADGNVVDTSAQSPWVPVISPCWQWDIAIMGLTWRWLSINGFLQALPISSLNEKDGYA
jgi:hypothetical protein